jgi:hypothetical protein
MTGRRAAWLACVLAGSAAIAAPASASAKSCRPAGHVLARHKGVVFWSERQGSRTVVDVCAPPSYRTELVASGGKYLYPAVDHVSVAGHFVGFFYYTHYSDMPKWIVFDLGRGRREFTTSPPPSAYQDPLRFFVAPNGWVAAALLLGTSPADPFVQEDQLLFATKDGTSYYTIDLVTLSPVSLTGSRLHWTSSTGGASSVQVGPDLIPSSSPQPLTACEVLTASDVAPVLGETTSSSAPAHCTYASKFTAGMTLTVSLQTGLTAAQQSAQAAALTAAGWDGLVSEVGAFHEYEHATTIAGVTHQQLTGFVNGVELSLDLAMPNVDPGAELAGLADKALDRLFGVPVKRTY